MTSWVAILLWWRASRYDFWDLPYLWRFLTYVEGFGLLVYLRMPCIFADVMETKPVYLAQRYSEETNVVISREFGGNCGDKGELCSAKSKRASQLG